MARQGWTRALLAALLAGGGAQAQPVADFVGINVHLPPDDELDAAQHLGTPWIRIDNNWLSVERQRGVHDWGSLDRVVAGAGARGLSVFMTIAYAPAWATDGGQDASAVNDVPRAADFAAYVEATVARYAPQGVTHFGIWNEPNLDHFFEGTVDAYVDRVLVPGAEAVRRACPTCRVLGPDLAGLSGWQGYLEAVLRRAGDQFDILTHHTYAPAPTVRPGWACDDFDHALDIGDDAICFYKPGLRQVLDAAGWDGPVWLTEAGYRADPWDNAGAQARQRATVEYIVTRQRQTPWWQGTFFYELTDCRPAQPDCEIDGFGLMRRVAGAGVASDRASWREHFVFKPAFEWLREHIANPAPLPPDPPPDPPEPVDGGPAPDGGASDGAPPETDDADRRDGLVDAADAAEGGTDRVDALDPSDLQDGSAPAERDASGGDTDSGRGAQTTVGAGGCAALPAGAPGHLGRSDTLGLPGLFGRSGLFDLSGVLALLGLGAWRGARRRRRRA